MTSIRNPAVAGQFYPDSPESLRSQVESLITKNPKKIDAIGIVSPHAGYIYSGPVAGSIFGAIEPKKRYIVMGPNHTGLGEPFGLSMSAAWKTPLGEIKIDRSLAEKIKEGTRYVKDDDTSHSNEHSIEVQLPFLQFIQKDFTFVPITISYAGLDVYIEVGKAMAKAIKDMGIEKDTAIIASSDMTHYESQESAERKDHIAIDAILKLNEKKLVEDVARLNISMCGYAPTVIMMAAAKELGARHAKLVRYQTSGDTSGDYSSVVGYAGIAVYK